ATGELAIKLRGRDVAKRIVLLEVAMEFIGLAANYEDVSAVAILKRNRIADNETSLIVEVEKQPRIQIEGYCSRQLGEVVIIDVIFSLVVYRTEERVAEAAEFVRVEQREVGSK